MGMLVPPRDELQRIPGIGPSLARDLRTLGIRRVADLRGKDPERLYRRLGEQRGVRQDPCVLYTFRCAVYFAGTRRPDPAKLKWWWWKDRGARPGPARRAPARSA
jgi:Pathogenicity locus